MSLVKACSQSRSSDPANRGARVTSSAGLNHTCRPQGFGRAGQTSDHQLSPVETVLWAPGSLAHPRLRGLRGPFMWNPCKTLPGKTAHSSAPSIPDHTPSDLVLMAVGLEGPAHRSQGTLLQFSWFGTMVGDSQRRWAASESMHIKAFAACPREPMFV